jgi:thiopurine S-methyltransferase
MSDDIARADAENWLARWREGRTNFHQESPSPMLVEFWDAIDAPKGARVFVPLAGKTVDMPWLAERGHRVFGVELVALAVEQFFVEQGLAREVTQTPIGALSTSGPIELLCADVFALQASDLAECDAVSDRAALIALPPPLRERYVREVYTKLPSGCRGLLVTLEFPQEQKPGPPFSVPESEVRALFERDWTIEVLARRDMLAKNPSFVDAGVTSLDVVVYRLQRR